MTRLRVCGTAKTKNFVTESTEKGDFVFMKKPQWMSLLLAAAMAVSVLPAGAFAEEADEAAGETQPAVVSQQEQTAPSTTEVQPAGTVSDAVTLCFGANSALDCQPGDILEYVPDEEG